MNVYTYIFYIIYMYENNGDSERNERQQTAVYTIAIRINGYDMTQIWLNYLRKFYEYLGVGEGIGWAPMWFIASGLMGDYGLWVGRGINRVGNKRFKIRKYFSTEFRFGRQISGISNRVGNSFWRSPGLFKQKLKAHPFLLHPFDAWRHPEWVERSKMA